MATVANLVVKISAQATALQRNLDQARRRVAAFSKAAIARLKQIGVALAAAFAAASTAIVFQINKTSQKIDALVKTSQKLNIPVDQLQKLRFAAERAGISSQTLEMGLQRMVRRAAAAAQGTGEAKDTIKALGISAKELNRLSPDQQFLKIADAMSKIGVQGNKVLGTQKIFDSEGVELVKLFNGELRQTIAEFNKFGVAITASQAKAIASFEDAKTNLGLLFTSIKQQVTANVAPLFTALVNHIIETIDKMGGIRKAAMSFTIALVDGIIAGVESIQFLLKAFDAVGIVIDGLRAAYQRFIILVIRSVEVFNRLGTAFQEIGTDKPGFGIGAAIFELTQQSKRGAQAIKEAQADAGELEKALGQRIRDFGKGFAVENLKQLSDKLKEAARDIKQGVEEAKEVTKQVSPNTVGGGGSFSSRDRRRLDRLIRSDTPASEIKINITGDVAEFLNFVAENTQFGDKVQQIINVNTERARRRIDR